MIKNIFIALFLVTNLYSLNLDTLLSDVKKSTNEDLKSERQRVQEFINSKNRQATLLKNAKDELKRENDLTTKLQKDIQNKEVELAKLEEVLKAKTGDLGEMFGSLRQSSSDFLTNFESALTSSQFENRDEVFKKYANSKELPNTKELTKFWHLMLEEVIESGKVKKYNTDVILSSGEKVNKEVVRVGLFAAASDGNYLNYSHDLKSLVELSKQPNIKHQQDAKTFQKKDNEIKNILIDPTRGVMFSMLANNPTLLDRINQGGIVGYIILALGAIGLLFALIKIILLNISHIKIKSQIKNINTPKENNSLGKIAITFHANLNDKLEELEIKMSESILRETNSIKRGQSFVKLLAAVTPLLGLLGTVTGMITTFQAITLFGTGDPKLMAGGISTALITTVLGLVTAIPLLFAYTYINSKSERLVSILEEQSIGMLAKSLK